MVSKDKLKKATELRQGGASYRTIAKKVGLSVSTVHSYLRYIEIEEGTTGRSRSSGLNEEIYTPEGLEIVANMFHELVEDMERERLERVRAAQELALLPSLVIAEVLKEMKLKRL